MWVASEYIFLLSQRKISWHPSASGFVGSGVTDNGVLFSYISNWDCPGRWSVEIITNKRRFILSPLEELKEKKIWVL